jgi:hypothetical protein
MQDAGVGPAPDGISLIPGTPAPHQSKGVGSAGLGKYSGDGSFEITGYLSETEANFSGNFTFVAANGDKLACNYGVGGTGVVTLIAVCPGVYRATFVADFVPIPDQCTGKFAGVTGSWTMYGASGEFTIDGTTEQTSTFIYGWEGEGKLTFPK